MLLAAAARSVLITSHQPDAVKYHSADANLVTEQPFNQYSLVEPFEDPVLDSLVDRHWHRTNASHARVPGLPNPSLQSSMKKNWTAIQLSGTASLPVQQGMLIPGFVGDHVEPATNFTAEFDALGSGSVRWRVSTNRGKSRTKTTSRSKPTSDVKVIGVAELAINYFELRARNGASPSRPKAYEPRETCG